MLEKLETLDRQLFLFLNGMHADWLDPVMWWISSIVLWIPLFLFIIYYSWKKGSWQLAVSILLGLAICILLSDRISVELFKEVFQRYRPTHHTEIGDLVHTVVKPNGEEYRGGLYSFVSSHATNFMSIAMFVFLSLKQFSKKWWWLFPIAILVAYSRIYLGVHYPADIICGGILGAIIGYLVNWANVRWNPLLKKQTNE